MFGCWVYFSAVGFIWDFKLAFESRGLVGGDPNLGWIIGCRFSIWAERCYNLDGDLGYYNLDGDLGELHLIHPQKAVTGYGDLGRRGWS